MTLNVPGCPQRPLIPAKGVTKLGSMARVAELLVAIARNGTQVFVATHSLFIMRELSMLLGKTENADVGRCFIALENTIDGALAKSGQSAEEIEPITALDAEIEQSQRYLESLQPAGKS